MAFKDNFRAFLVDKTPEPKVEVKKAEMVKEETIIETKEEFIVNTDNTIITNTVDTVKEEISKNVVSTVSDFVESIEKELAQDTGTEKEQFDRLAITNDDLLELKKIAFSEIVEQELVISELVDLVLLAKSGKKVQDKNRDSLVIREFIDNKGKITMRGKVYLEESTTKERLRAVLS